MLTFYLVVAWICWGIYNASAIIYFLALKYGYTKQGVWVIYKEIHIDPNKLSGYLWLVVLMSFGGVIEGLLWPIELPAKIYPIWRYIKEIRAYDEA